MKLNNFKLHYEDIPNAQPIHRKFLKRLVLKAYKKTTHTGNKE